MTPHEQTQWTDHRGRALVRLAEAAKRAGVSANQLQYYLYMGVIEPEYFSDAGQRLFGTQDIKRVRLVKELNDSGYPLREIREIFMEKRDGRKK